MRKLAILVVLALSMMVISTVSADATMCFARGSEVIQEARTAYDIGQIVYRSVRTQDGQLIVVQGSMDWVETGSGTGYWVFTYASEYPCPERPGTGYYNSNLQGTEVQVFTRVETFGEQTWVYGPTGAPGGCFGGWCLEEHTVQSGIQNTGGTLVRHTTANNLLNWASPTVCLRPGCGPLFPFP